MLDICKAASEALNRGENLVLVFVLEAHGSAPRGTGAAVAVFANGHCMGTIGGGSVEHEAKLTAEELLHENSGLSLVKSYNLTASGAANIGMVCGGQVSVYFQYISSNPTTCLFFSQVAEHATSNEDWWYALQTQGQNWVAFFGNGSKVSASSTQNANYPNPHKISSRPMWHGTPKDGTLFIPLSAQGHVYLFGAGHVAQKLAAMLNTVNFYCTVIDDREEFANPNLFPNSQILVQNVNTAFNTIQVTQHDYIVIMTRGHISDYDVLRHALNTKARYIGMMGSKTKISATYTKLVQEENISYETLARVHAPIGLAIGAETPEEIALCIAAQLVQIRNTTPENQT